MPVLTVQEIRQLIPKLDSDRYERLIRRVMHLASLDRVNELYDRYGISRYAGKDMFVIEITEEDIASSTEGFRDQLLALLDADPANALAREYLMCYDLMGYNLDGFMEQYAKDRPKGRLYSEAVLIWLSQHDQLNPEGVARYGVDVSEVDRMGRFGQNPNAFKNTYWYYYLMAMQEAQK